MSHEVSYLVEESVLKSQQRQWICFLSSSPETMRSSNLSQPHIIYRKLMYIPIFARQYNGCHIGFFGHEYPNQMQHNFGGKCFGLYHKKIQDPQLGAVNFFHHKVHERTGWYCGNVPHLYSRGTHRHQCVTDSSVQELCDRPFQTARLKPIFPSASRDPFFPAGPKQNITLRNPRRCAKSVR